MTVARKAHRGNVQMGAAATVEAEALAATATRGAQSQLEGGRGVVAAEHRSTIVIDGGWRTESHAPSEQLLPSKQQKWKSAPSLPASTECQVPPAALTFGGPLAGAGSAPSLAVAPSVPPPATQLAAVVVVQQPATTAVVVKSSYRYTTVDGDVVCYTGDQTKKWQLSPFLSCAPCPCQRSEAVEYSDVGSRASGPLGAWSVPGTTSVLGPISAINRPEYELGASPPQGLEGQRSPGVSGSQDGDSDHEDLLASVLELPPDLLDGLPEATRTLQGRFESLQQAARAQRSHQAPREDVPQQATRRAGSDASATTAVSHGDGASAAGLSTSDRGLHQPRRAPPRRKAPTSNGTGSASAASAGAGAGAGAGASVGNGVADGSEVDHLAFLGEQYTSLMASADADDETTGYGTPRDYEEQAPDGPVRAQPPPVPQATASDTTKRQHTSVHPHTIGATPPAPAPVSAPSPPAPTPASAPAPAPAAASHSPSPPTEHNGSASTTAAASAASASAGQQPTVMPQPSMTLESFRTVT